MPLFTLRKYEWYEAKTEIVDVEPSEGVKNARKHLERIEEKMDKIWEERKKVWAEYKKYGDLIEKTYPNRCHSCNGTGKSKGQENACCVPDGWDPLHRNAWDFSKEERKEEAYLRGPFKKHPAFDLEAEAWAKYEELRSQLSRLNNDHVDWLDNQIWHEKEQLRSLGYVVDRIPGPNLPRYVIKGHIRAFKEAYFWDK